MAATHLPAVVMARRSSGISRGSNATYSAPVGVTTARVIRDRGEQVHHMSVRSTDCAKVLMSA